MRKLITIFLPFIDIKIVLSNSSNIGTFFNYKDKVYPHLMSRVIYEYNCPFCKKGNYIGSTTRSLHIRMHEHIGKSYRTNRFLSSPSFSAIRLHSDEVHRCLPKTEDFKILKQTKDDIALRIVESLYIQQKQPTLNKTSSALSLICV